MQIPVCLLCIAYALRLLSYHRRRFVYCMSNSEVQISWVKHNDTNVCMHEVNIEQILLMRRKVNVWIVSVARRTR